MGNKSKYVFKPAIQGGCPQCKRNGKIYYIMDRDIGSGNHDYALYVRTDYPKPVVIKCKNAHELLEKVGYVPLIPGRKENPDSVLDYIGRAIPCTNLREYKGYIIATDKTFWKRPIRDDERISCYGSYKEILDYAKNYLKELDDSENEEILPDVWRNVLYSDKEDL